MIKTMTQMTDQTPFGLALPMSAAAFGGVMAGLGNAAVCAVPATPTYAVRDRHVAGIAFAQVSRPGSTAWSPPIC